MDETKGIKKGYQMEENLRNYFLEMGYFVVRGVKYNFKDTEGTDIDLFLYNRPTILSRERINVDIKNKKTPQAMERIFVAKGLQSILGFDKCIVATKDNRDTIKEFANILDVIILDGFLLNKISSRINRDRFTEEELFEEISKDSLGKLSGDWRAIIENMKSSLLDKFDYSGCINSLECTKYFIEQCITNPKRKEISCRCSFLLISFFLIKLDFILKDVAFLENDIKQRKITNGFKYGNLGETGMRKFINIAKQLIPENQAVNLNNQIQTLYNSIPVNIISEYYTKNDVSKNLFKNAKEFEKLAYNRNFRSPNILDNELKSIISISLDYFGIERKSFFDTFD